MKSTDIDSIVIHCSATREGADFKAADIDKWHKQQGWKMIGYHFVIDLDGTVETGRPLTMNGAHCNTCGFSDRPYNSHSIGICYIGGLSKDGKTAKDTRTDAQKESLRNLVDDLFKKYPNIIEILGHRDCSPDLDGDGEIEPSEWIKSCPSFDVREEFPIALCIEKR